MMVKETKACHSRGCGNPVLYFFLGAALVFLLMLPFVNYKAPARPEPDPVYLNLLKDFDRQLTVFEDMINQDYYRQKLYVKLVEEHKGIIYDSTGARIYGKRHKAVHKSAKDIKGKK